MAAETLHAGVGVDVRDFAAFARALRKAAPDIRVRLLRNLRAVGEIVAGEARATVQPYSHTVPDSVKVRVSGATVSVVAGGADVPMGALLELGNKGSRSTDAFRHPVFGTAAFVAQPMHPYLTPALLAKIGEVETAAVEALDYAIAEVVTR